MRPLLSFQKISKRYGHFFANQNIDLDLFEHEILGLVGENGAGKSTLVKILFGLIEPSSGQILKNGAPLPMGKPQLAKDLGIAMVHQHFELAMDLTVLDHLLLELTPPSGVLRFVGGLNKRHALIKIRDLESRYQIKLNLQAQIGDLDLAQRQKVEIAKALINQPQILILDEPTAMLSPFEIKKFLEQLQSIAKAGTSILFISHKLKEVKQICSRIAVLRKGQINTVLTNTPQLSLSEIALSMTGRTFETSGNPETSAPSSEAKKIIVSAHDIELIDTDHKKRLQALSFELRGGQITGVAGVMGNGQSEILQAFAGQIPTNWVTTGSLKFKGLDLLKLSPSFICSLPLAVTPEDRQTQGLILDFSIIQNYRIRYPGKTIDAHQVISLLEQLSLDPLDIHRPTREFSGGNQQKILLARELLFEPQVLILAHPTRGVDTYAAQKIYKAILKRKSEGCAILIISSELEELLQISDDLLVLYNGHLQGSYFRPFDIQKIAPAMTGGLVAST